MPVERLSLRLSVVVLPVSPSDLAGTPLARDLQPADQARILTAALLDVVGALVRIDGVTIVAIAPAEADGRELLAGLPAGVEVIDAASATAASGEPLPAVALAVRALLDRRFDRVVAVAGDAVRLTPRIVATALSALGGADLAVGPTRGDGYLVGVRDQRGVAALAGLSPGRSFGGTPLIERARELGLVVRRTEPLPRLAELDGRAALAAAVAPDPEHAPRLAEALRGLGG